jgi:hypothetical protein
MEKDHEGGIYNRDKPNSKSYRTTETANTHTHTHTHVHNIFLEYWQGAQNNVKLDRSPMQNVQQLSHRDCKGKTLQEDTS